MRNYERKWNEFRYRLGRRMRFLTRFHGNFPFHDVQQYSFHIAEVEEFLRICLRFCQDSDEYFSAEPTFGSLRGTFLLTAKAAKHRVRGGHSGKSIIAWLSLTILSRVAWGGEKNCCTIVQRTYGIAPSQIDLSPNRLDMIFKLSFAEKFSALRAFRRWLPSTPVSLWLLALGRKFLMEALNRSLGRVGGSNRGSSRLERLKSFLWGHL